MSHVGLNNEEQWDEFRDLDTQDQQIVKGWARSEDSGSDGSAGDGDAEQVAQRFDTPVAQDERISHFLNRSFLDPSDDRVIEEMLDAKGPGGFSFRDLGITADQLRAQLAHRREHKEEAAEEVPVQPQVRRQTLRHRLDTLGRIRRDTGSDLTVSATGDSRNDRRVTVGEAVRLAISRCAGCEDARISYGLSCRTFRARLRTGADSSQSRPSRPLSMRIVA